MLQSQGRERRYESCAGNFLRCSDDILPARRGGPGEGESKLASHRHDITLCKFQSFEAARATHRNEAGSSEMDGAGESGQVDGSLIWALVFEEITDAGRSLDSCHGCIFRGFGRLRSFLRSHEIRGLMDTQSLIMLIISALVTVYLFYAVLRPEKF